MERTDGNSYARGFVTGALIGGLAGAVVALLFAPKSGRELRRDIAERTSELYDRAQEALNPKQLGEELPPVAINQGKLRAQAIVDAARQHAEQLLSSAEQVLRDARTKATHAKEQIQENIERVREAANASVEAFRSELSSGE
jgi:gas vesicle protein